MKKILLLLLTVSSLTIFAQNNISISKSNYDVLKKNHQLDLTKNYIFTDAITPTSRLVPYQGPVKTFTDVCDCMIPLDSTFNYVPFVNYIGTTNGNVIGPNNMNDDASSIPINLPFSFNFYGTAYNTVYINNNGNISFNAPYSTFTANPFPDPSYNMIAPFWGDVDTRDFNVPAISNVVYFKTTPTAMIVKWENVGYYDMHLEKLNTFQLIITNGTDTLLPAGLNVGFCYGDMNWTTGDASGGGFGYGGIPATVGVNKGNGVDYFQVGRFDHIGSSFDGPYNGSDGIDWLDYQNILFNVADTGNIPPVIVNNNICDTIDVYTGDTILRTSYIDTVLFDLGVSTPEINQTVIATITCSEPSAFSYTQTMNTNTYKKYSCQFIAQNLPLGLYYVTIIATDNGIPTKQTVNTVVIRSNYDNGTVNINERDHLEVLQIYPNPTYGIINIEHHFKLTSYPKVIITDVLGNFILETPLNQQKQTIDISNLTKGIYFFTLNNNEGQSKTIKVVHQ